MRALFTATDTGAYDQRPMPQPTRGTGPWGEAIRYWLDQKKKRQSDLQKGSGLKPNTISRATRGLDVNTKSLRGIARALGVPIEDVLVSPGRRMADEGLERRIREAVSVAIRLDREQRSPSDVFMESLRADEEAARGKHPPTRHRQPQRSTKR